MRRYKDRDEQGGTSPRYISEKKMNSYWLLKIIGRHLLMPKNKSVNIDTHRKRTAKNKIVRQLRVDRDLDRGWKKSGSVTSIWS